MALTSIKGIGPSTETKLQAAGIETIEQLAAADAGGLAERTGISEGQVRSWVQQARAQTRSPSADAVEPGPAPKAAGRIARNTLKNLENARIVIAEGMEKARVKIQDDVVAEVPILTARAKETAEARLKQFRGDVIVLREKTDTALLRLEEEIYEGLPLFKEKLDEGAAEVRVRVREIREKRLEPAVRTLGERVRGMFEKRAE